MKAREAAIEASDKLHDATEALRLANEELAETQEQLKPNPTDATLKAKLKRKQKVVEKKKQDSETAAKKAKSANTSANTAEVERYAVEAAILTLEEPGMTRLPAFKDQVVWAPMLNQMATSIFVTMKENAYSTVKAYATLCSQSVVDEFNKASGNATNDSTRLRFQSHRRRSSSIREPRHSNSCSSTRFSCRMTAA